MSLFDMTQIVQITCTSFSVVTGMVLLQIDIRDLAICLSSYRAGYRCLFVRWVWSSCGASFRLKKWGFRSGCVSALLILGPSLEGLVRKNVFS